MIRLVFAGALIGFGFYAFLFFISLGVGGVLGILLVLALAFLCGAAMEIAFPTPDLNDPDFDALRRDIPIPPLLGEDPEYDMAHGLVPQQGDEDYE